MFNFRQHDFKITKEFKGDKDYYVVYRNGGWIFNDWYYLNLFHELEDAESYITKIKKTRKKEVIKYI